MIHFSEKTEKSEKKSNCFFVETELKLFLLDSPSISEIETTLTHSSHSGHFLENEVKT